MCPLSTVNPIHHWLRIFGFATALLGSQSATAAPISITATSPGPPPITLSQEGSNFASLVERVVRRQGELEALFGTDFTARITYLGVPDAAVISISADGKEATITINETGFSRDFQASDSDELNEQLQNFIRKEGSSEIASLRRKVNRRSPAGLTDGNPVSTTALISADILANFNDLLRQREIRQHVVRFDFEGAAYEAGDFSAWRFGARLDYHYRANARFGISAFLPVNDTDLEGGRIYGVGGGIALPTFWKARPLGRNFSSAHARDARWVLAPFLAGSFRWS